MDTDIDQIYHNLKCLLSKLDEDKSIIISPIIQKCYHPSNVFVIPINAKHLCPYPKKFMDTSIDIRMMINFISSIIHYVYENSQITNDKIQVFIETVVTDNNNNIDQDETDHSTDQSFRWDSPENIAHSRKGFFKPNQKVSGYRLWFLLAEEGCDLLDRHTKTVLDNNNKTSSYAYNARRVVTSPSGIPLITGKMNWIEIAKKIIYNNVANSASDKHPFEYDTISLHKIFSPKGDAKKCFNIDTQGQWSFKRPYNIVKLDVCNVKLDSILNMYLPDYQSKIIGVEYYILYTLVNALGVYDDSNYDVHMKTLDDDYEELGQFSNIIKQAMTTLNSSQEFKTMVDNYLIDRFTYIAMSYSSNVSEVGKAVTTYLHKKMPSFHKTRIPLKIYDRRLGIFSNFMIWFMNMCEQYLVLSTSHWSFCKCYFGTLDAFRIDYNSLHFNSFMVGDPQSGKSFIFQKLKEMSFEGNVTEFSQWSKNALTTNSKFHDQVLVFHEAPPELFCSSSSSSSSSSNSRSRPTEPWIGVMKDMLTRSVLSFYYNAGVDPETRERTSKMISKPVYSSIIFVTNDSPKNVDSALMTRFMLDFSTTGSRHSKSANNLNASFKHFTTEEDKILHYYLKSFSAHMRVKIYLVFKLIYNGLLPKINCFVTDYVLSELDKYLLKHNMRQVDGRTRDKVNIFIIIFTIVNGLIHLYELETSKYTKSAFEIKQLLDMRPFMEDSEEIAVFTIGFLTRSIYDPIEKIILIILGHIHRGIVNSSNLRAFKTTGSFCNNNSTSSVGSKRSFNVVSELNELDTDNYDPNWLYFPMNKNNLVKEICNNYPTGMAGKPPETQVAIILDNIAQRQMMIDNYKFSQFGRGIERIDKSRELKANNIDFRDYATFIHTSVVYGKSTSLDELNDRFVKFKRTLIVENNNPVMDFITEIMSYNLSKEKSMLYGEIESYKYPYIFSVIKLKPNKDKQLILTNNWFSGVKVDSMNQNITKVFDVPLDTCGRYELIRSMNPSKYKPIMEVDSMKKLIQSAKNRNLKDMLKAMDPTAETLRQYKSMSDDQFMGLVYGKDSIHKEKIVNIILILHDDTCNTSILDRYKKTEDISKKEMEKMIKYVRKIDDSITDEDFYESLCLFYGKQYLL